MKYIILPHDKLKLSGCTFYRIQANKDFGNVKVGDLGGYVTNEENLSHEGYCWIADNAMVADQARVFDNAQVCENAFVCNKVRVFGNSKIFGSAIVKHHVRVFGNGRVSGNATVQDFATVFGCGRVFGSSIVGGQVSVCGEAHVAGEAVVDGDIVIGGQTRIAKAANIKGEFICSDNPRLYGKSTVPPINITGLPYRVTIQDNMVTMGCATFPLRDWLMFSKQQIKQIECGQDPEYHVDDLWDVCHRFIKPIGEIARIANRPVNEDIVYYEDHFKPRTE